MSASNSFRNKIVNHFLRNTSQTPAATLYAALLTAVSSEPTESVTEVSTGSSSNYARQAIAFDAPSAGVTQNSSVINYPVAGGNYSGAVTHVGIYDASTSGNLLKVIALASSVTILTGQQLSFAAGALIVTVD